MANEDGLFDEHEADAFGSSSLQAKNGGSSSRQNMLRRRMDMPLGTNPAAKVVRRSPPSSTPGATAASTTDQNDQSKQGFNENPREYPSEGGSNSKPAVLGSIVERPRRSRKSRAQDLADGTDKKVVAGNAMGFPSLLVPIGRFLEKSSKSVAHQREKSSVPSQSEDGNSKPSALTKLREESSKEAETMFSQMSLAEISESKRELEQMLSPQLVSFLRQRHKVKHGSNNNSYGPSKDQLSADKSLDVNTTVQSDDVPIQPANAIKATEEKSHNSVVSASTEIQENSADSESKSNPSTGDNQVRTEKELKLFKRLALIQSEKDLDAVYQDEHNGESNPFFLDTDSDMKNKTRSSDEDFRVACDLLRSAVPRQNLWAARTIRNVLWQQLNQRHRTDSSKVPAVKSSPSSSPPSEYPLTLPVALRCLLDASASHRANNGYILHAHVLQAFYFLLRIRVASDHDVDVTSCDGGSSDDGDDDSKERWTNHSIYQQWFMDDAVPSAPVDQAYQIFNKIESLSVNGQQNVAYASASSSESATRDGHNFWSDPLWTLLSQMRIIPRLAQLVEKSSSIAPTGSLLLLRVPNEGISAICGILAMIAQRSPGAAAAISQYENLTSNLLAMALAEIDDSMDTSILLPVVILFSVLARQSYVAAESLEPHVEDLLTRVLSMVPAEAQPKPDRKIIHIQQWSLVLWRTLLRYGYGMDYLEMALTVTASQRAVGIEQWPCYAHLLSCLEALFRNNKLQHSIRWAVASIENSCIQCLEEYSEKESTFDLTRNEIRNIASCLGFLEALHQHQSLPSSNNDTLADSFTHEEESHIRGVIKSLWHIGFVTKAFKTVLKNFFDPWPKVEDPRSLGTIEMEAVLSLFVCNFLSLLRNETGQRWIGEEERHAMWQELASIVKAEAQRNSLPQSDTKQRCFFSSARCAWRNLAHLLAVEIVLDQLRDDDADPIIALGLSCALVGRFQMGEEALAQKLLKLTLVLPPPNQTHYARLSAMLLSNLNSTSERTAQLNHSIQLYNRFVPQVESIQDLLVNLSPPSAKSSDMLFPVGRYWIWKVFAGSSDNVTLGGRENLSTDFVAVVEAACQIILELERAASNGQCHYCTNLNMGGKLYYVMNLCLQDEAFLDHEEVTDVADQLVMMYSDRFDRMANQEFIAECLSHSACSAAAVGNKGNNDNNDQEAENLTEDERTAKAWLSTGASTTVPKDLTNFVYDLCAAYTKYGAQYGIFFTRCMRTFLLPSFPVKIRCEVLHRLDGLLHLFTIEKDDSELCQALMGYLQIPKVDVNAGFGGCSMEDERDDPEWLDSLTRMFSKGAGQQREDLKFMKGMAIYSVGRSILQSRKKEVLHDWEHCKMRLVNLEHNFALACINMAIYMVYSSSTLKQVQYALNPTLEGAHETIKDMDETTWAKVFDLLAVDAR
ncbi:hypothetical protein ACA910_016099 [Epithemia clementina (nom. ined.)]